MNPPANTGAAEKRRMSGELMATLGTILTVGVAIAGIILVSNGALREDVRELRGAIQSLGERVAKIEGKLEVTLPPAPAAEGG